MGSLWDTKDQAGNVVYDGAKAVTQNMTYSEKVRRKADSDLRGLIWKMTDGRGWTRKDWESYYFYYMERVERLISDYAAKTTKYWSSLMKGFWLIAAHVDFKNRIDGKDKTDNREDRAGVKSE